MIIDPGKMIGAGIIAAIVAAAAYWNLPLGLGLMTYLMLVNTEK